VFILRKLIKLNNTAVYLETVDTVPQDFVSTVLNIIEFAYRVFGEIPDLVEIYIYEDSQKLLQNLYNIATELGVTTIAIYPVSHDAWLGWPRIHIDYSTCRNLDGEIFEALLIHEATHTVLHGNIQSYVVTSLNSIPQEFREPEVVYLASVAVKDAEVFTYLARKGLEKYVKTYLRYVEPELKKMRCRNLEEVLELAKLLTPCIAIECSKDIISEECEELYDKVIESLLKTINTENGLTEKIAILLLQLSRVTRK
jgi:hypothetical protein